MPSTPLRDCLLRNLSKKAEILRGIRDMGQLGLTTPDQSHLEDQMGLQKANLQCQHLNLNTEGQLSD